MKKVVVIGAGPAGLTAALRLVEAGWSVEVCEASPYVGGMARSMRLWDCVVDLGPHRFFTRDKRVNALWQEMIGDDFQAVDRLTRIYYRRKFFDYPLRPANVLGHLGVVEAARCGLSYAAQLCRTPFETDAAESFEEWVVRAFGRRVYDLFFRDYTEKLWGIPGDHLDADFAAQRIRKFSMARAAFAALGLERDRHKTLVHRFHHPVGGSGLLYERMAERIRAAGGTIRLQTPVAGIRVKGRGVVLRDGEELESHAVVSTMPLTRMCATLPGLPDELRTAVDGLRYRHTILVYLKVDGTDLFPDQWLYIQTPELRFGRVTNFRNWPAERPPDADFSILALEYWCDAEDALWSASEDELIALATREIRATGLTGNAAIRAGHVERLPNCYPVYRCGYRNLLEPIANHLREHFPMVLAIGRYGAFKYNNQDHSILMGLLAAEKLVKNSPHSMWQEHDDTDLWAVNTDYDEYQEE